MGLTIFTIPWAQNVDPVLIHRQNNALRSWEELDAEVDIILCGNEAGIAELCERRGYVHASTIDYLVGAPVIPSVFEVAEELATTDVLMYANADDIFLQDLIDAIEIVADAFDRWMMVGQKWDIEIDKPLDFSDGWQGRLAERVAKYGQIHGGSAVDYYVYSMDYPVGVDFPDFVIGGTGWDTWLVDDTLRRGFAVVDVTDAVLCVHQHKVGSRPGESRTHNQRLFHKRLSEQRRTYDDVKGKTNWATWELLADGTLREVPEHLRGVAREKRDWGEPKLNVPGWDKTDRVKAEKVARNGRSLNVLESRGD